MECNYRVVYFEWCIIFLLTCLRYGGEVRLDVRAALFFFFSKYQTNRISRIVHTYIQIYLNR